ncbi:hypothetical protein D3C85_15490 [compost metagenome]
MGVTGGVCDSTVIGAPFSSDDNNRPSPSSASIRSCNSNDTSTQSSQIGSEMKPLFNAEKYIVYPSTTNVRSFMPRVVNG